jgi:hypothetical protein
MRGIFQRDDFGTPDGMGGGITMGASFYRCENYSRENRSPPSNSPLPFPDSGMVLGG